MTYSYAKTVIITELSLIKREKKVASRSKKEEKHIKLTKNKLQDKQKHTQRDKIKEKISAAAKQTKQNKKSQQQRM